MTSEHFSSSDALTFASSPPWRASTLTLPLAPEASQVASKGASWELVRSSGCSLNLALRLPLRPRITPSRWPIVTSRFSFNVASRRLIRATELSQWMDKI